MRVGDDDEAIVLDLHALVLEAELAAKFHAADFKPGEIISMINDAHLVGFGVSDTHCGFGVVRHRRKIVTEWRSERERASALATAEQEGSDVCLTTQRSDVRLPRTSSAWRAELATDGRRKRSIRAATVPAGRRNKTAGFGGAGLRQTFV